jgi:hypothetical protein
MAAQLEEGTDLREQAIRRVKKKADFRAHLFVYVVVNSVIVAIWAFTGSGFFWPVFPILVWGTGVVFNAWDVYARSNPTEGQIHREMEHLRDRAAR